MHLLHINTHRDTQTQIYTQKQHRRHTDTNLHTKTAQYTYAQVHTHTLKYRYTNAHIHTHTYTLNRHTIAHNRTHTKPHNTHNHTHTHTHTHTHDVALSPFLTLSSTHTPSSKVLLVDSLNRFCSVDRAIEKIVRSYKSNISLVCDVVRQVVVFDSISDMVSMLRAMNADPHVKIMRIKNRMSSGLKLCNAHPFALLCITPHHIM